MKFLPLLLAVSALCRSFVSASTRPATPRSTVPTVPRGNLPTLFPLLNETKYDRYAACLAATEGLRRARDALSVANPSTLQQQQDRGAAVSGQVGVGAAARNVLRTAVSERLDVAELSGKGGTGDTPSGPGGKADASTFTPGRFWGLAGSREPARAPIDDEAHRRASAAYVVQAAKVVRGMGLTIPQFNQLGREVGRDPYLKERVVEQAYLYRVAATLGMDKIPLSEDPISEQLLKAHRRRRVQMFARSLTAVEELREEQQEKLCKSLDVETLPDGLSICDPAVLPLLNNKVKAVCEAFPRKAEQVIKKYGLNSDEFNEMLDQTKKNAFFRWRVRNYMGKSEKAGGKE